MYYKFYEIFRTGQLTTGFQMVLLLPKSFWVWVSMGVVSRLLRRLKTVSMLTLRNRSLLDRTLESLELGGTTRYANSNIYNE